MSRWDTELGPVRRALADATRREVDELGEAAGREAEALAALAREDAEELLEAARADGTAAGRAAAALVAARARREAHRVVLAERERLRAELVDRVVRAAAELPAAPDYPALVARLEEVCRERLGPRAEVAPAPGGGVVAVQGTRRLDLSLPLLAEQAALAVLEEAGDAWS